MGKKPGQSGELQPTFIVPWSQSKVSCMHELLQKKSRRRTVRSYLYFPVFRGGWLIQTHKKFVVYTEETSSTVSHTQ
jgi:hypothetical protein